MTLYHPITVYRGATGEVLWTQSAEFGAEDAGLGAGETWIAGSYSSADWSLPGGVPTPKEDFAPLVEVNRIANIPAGTTAMINGAAYPIDNGEITFDLDLPQTMRIALTHPLYRAHAALFEVPCEPVAAP